MVEFNLQIHVQWNKPDFHFSLGDFESAFQMNLDFDHVSGHRRDIKVIDQEIKFKFFSSLPDGSSASYFLGNSLENNGIINLFNE